MIVSIDTIMSVDRNYSCPDRICLHTALEGAEAASILHQSTHILNSAKSSYWLKAFAALNKKFNALQLKFSCSSSTMAMQRDMPLGEEDPLDMSLCNTTYLHHQDSLPLSRDNTMMYLHHQDNLPTSLGRRRGGVSERSVEGQGNRMLEQTTLPHQSRSHSINSPSKG